MSQNQDQHCIDRVLLGDSGAFSILIDRYKHMVFTLAIKIVKNREDAEEIAQDVFLKAFEALKTFKGDSKFSTWLYKIAYYRSLDYLKKNKRKIETTMIDVSDEYNLASIDNALDRLEKEERQAMIKKAMEELPPDDGVIIVLHYFDELSLKEISKVMEIEVNTVKVRLFRSRKRLATILKNKMKPETIRNYGRA